VGGKSNNKRRGGYRVTSREEQLEIGGNLKQEPPFEKERKRVPVKGKRSRTEKGDRLTEKGLKGERTLGRAHRTADREFRPRVWKKKSQNADNKGKEKRGGKNCHRGEGTATKGPRGEKSLIEETNKKEKSDKEPQENSRIPEGNKGGAVKGK